MMNRRARLQTIHSRVGSQKQRERTSPGTSRTAVSYKRPQLAAKSSIQSVTCKDPGTKLPSKGPPVLHPVLHLLRSSRFLLFTTCGRAEKSACRMDAPPKRPCLRPAVAWIWALGSGFWRERRVGLDGAAARKVAGHPLNRDGGGALKGRLSVGVAPCKPLMEVG